MHPPTSAPDAEDPSTRFAAFFERSLVPAVAIDHREMAILDVNQATLDYIGLPRSEIIGRPGRDFLDEPSPDLMLRVRALRGDRTIVVRTVTTAFGDRVVQLNMAPSERPGISYVQLVDLTDLVEAAGRAEARADVLTRRVSALETLAERVAHDLRGPMTAISGFADVLVQREGELETQERVEMLARISRNTLALADMTSAMVAESRVGAGADDESHEVADLFEAVRSVAESQLREVGATLRTTTNVDHLPVPIGSIRQAVLNLVSNSIQYRHPDRRLLVEIEVTSGPSRVEITVRDNGSGLPENPDLLLHAGARGPNAEDTAGSGLGLAFAHAAVAAIDGTLTPHRRGIGAEMRIRLPASITPSDAEPRAVGASVATGLTAPGLMAIIDGSPIPTVVIDLAVRKILHANKACLEMFGRGDGDGIGQSASSFLSDPSIGDALRAAAIADPNGCHTAEATIETPQGLVPVMIWVSGVADTPLVVGQIVNLHDLGAALSERQPPNPGSAATT